ncbi:uncharacterized protein LOC108630125 isoform X1 [Ceratina calcarata]|uniref:Uncharacterized protein LOC108630125 isoform X1 n=2 Tax=Ceratina calcarata TaxID=156304 RepID=A0AAJ7WEN3_9HYME|nr:uncharacterized protein LOC108630125 isoform X1 [Ceratina calcarata]
MKCEVVELKIRALSNVDYQFVYVSKEIEILGTSSYFRFTMPPVVHPHERNSSTPRSHGIPVHEGHGALIASMTTCKGKRLGSSKSVDDVLRSCPSGYSFEDQRQRTCRFCMKSTSFTTNRIQFLLLHNQQLVARINRLDRDLELTEASVKNERTAKAALMKRLRAYETFVADLFRNLNVAGIVKIVDKSRKEVIVKRVKSKELISMRDEKGDKSLPIVDLSILSRSEKFNECKEKQEINCMLNRMEEIIHEPNLLSESEDEEKTVKIMENDLSHPMKKELVANREEKDFEIIVSIDEQQRRYTSDNPITVTELTESQWYVKIFENGRHLLQIALFSNSSYPYVTKEVTAGRREDNGCRATCKNEQPISVEGNSEHAKDIVGDDKRTTDNGNTSLVGSSKCCCDCHLNASKSHGANNNFDNDNVKEWALECECDLEIYDRTYQIIDNLAMEPDSSTVETANDGLSAILIKGRNSKFTVIRY